MGPFKDDNIAAFYLMNDASYEPTGKVLILFQNIQLILIPNYQFYSSIMNKNEKIGKQEVNVVV